MFEVVLIVAGVWPPEKLDSLPYVDGAVDGDGLQYPEEEGELSATDDCVKNPGGAH